MDTVDKDMLGRAIALAEEHSRTGTCGPFGAVVTLRGDIVGEGWNCVVSRCDPTAHAEVVAIRKACQTLNTHILADCVLYASCEPCPMCLASIYWARLSRVFYAATRKDAAAAGFDDECLYKEVALPVAERKIPFSRALTAQGRAVLSGWAHNPDRRMY